MDNADFKMQHDGVWYTLPELLDLMEPIYQEYEACVQKCILGLMQYAASLAASHQETQLPELRGLVTDMAEFWDLGHDESKDGYLKLRQKYGGMFDQTVEAARISGSSPVLSETVQEDILSGLRLYANEMTSSGGLERWVQQCDDLVKQLQLEWGEGPRQEVQGGMTFG